MAITLKTAADFITSMIDYIASYNAANSKNIDYRQGTVFKDIVVDTPAQAMQTMYADIDYANKLPSLEYASDIGETDLDAYAANFGLTRKSATAATGTATFITALTKTEVEDPGWTPVNVYINAGVRVRLPASTENDEVQFQVTSAVFIPLTDSLARVNYEYVDMADGGIVKYAIDAPISAVTTGAVGNTGPSTIVEIVDSITNISKTINRSSTIGGSDIESNVNFANRIKQKLSGNNIGTEAGIKSALYEDPRVKDVAIVKPGDPELLRNQYGGSIDVYILAVGGNDSAYEVEPYTNVLLFDGTSLSIRLTRPPVEGITRVTGTVEGVSGYVFAPNVDYRFDKDEGILKDSTAENSKITFINPDVLPDAGTYINVELTYDKTIEDLQLMFNQDDSHIVASDILIRKAYEKTVPVSLEITIFSGYSPVTIAAAVRDAISTYAQGLGLGQHLNPSDIIGVVEDVDGVDGVTLLSPTATIYAAKYEYVRVYPGGITPLKINGINY